MEEKVLPDNSISASEAARKTGIKYRTIQKWVDRGLVKVLYRPERAKACTGHPVLLDPVSLQERIDRYKPRQKKNKTPA